MGFGTLANAANTHVVRPTIAFARHSAGFSMPRAIDVVMRHIATVGSPRAPVDQIGVVINGIRRFPDEYIPNVIVREVKNVKYQGWTR